MRLIVIDAGIWVGTMRSNLARLIFELLTEHGFVSIVNNYLLSEVHAALLKNNWASIKQADLFVAYLKKSSFFIAGHAVYRLSPDPQDNYLFGFGRTTALRLYHQR